MFQITWSDWHKRTIQTISAKVLDCRNLDSIQEKFDGIVCGFIIPYLSKIDLSNFISSCSNTRPVVAGIVGVKKFQYDIWGDTVNTASRMESSGEVGKVNISQSTYELLKDDAQFVFENRGKIEAKGKGEMEMYFVSEK